MLYRCWFGRTQSDPSSFITRWRFCGSTNTWWALVQLYLPYWCTEGGQLKCPTRSSYLRASMTHQGCFSFKAEPIQFIGYLPQLHLSPPLPVLLFLIGSLAASSLQNKSKLHLVIYIIVSIRVCCISRRQTNKEQHKLNENLCLGFGAESLFTILDISQCETKNYCKQLQYVRTRSSCFTQDNQNLRLLGQRRERMFTQ
jgi:hypothetical protein